MAFFPRHRLFAVVAAGLLLAAAALPSAGADVFRARMLTGKAPVEPPLVNLQIEVESWTTPDEVRQFQDILSQQGVQPFLDAFSAANKGVVRFMYARGWNLPVHAALTILQEKGKRVLLFLNRQGWDPGSFQKPGRNYFMVIELKLNAKGKGEGRFYEDAQIKMDTVTGLIELETYESAPKVLPQAQEVAKKPEDKT